MRKPFDWQAERMSDLGSRERRGHGRTTKDSGGDEDEIGDAVDGQSTKIARVNKDRRSDVTAKEDERTRRWLLAGAPCE